MAVGVSATFPLYFKSIKVSGGFSRYYVCRLYVFKRSVCAAFKPKFCCFVLILRFSTSLMFFENFSEV